MVETFFFISLGISFLLIFLMVYHFKNRVDSLEESNVALADICKTLVYEMETIKKTLSFPPPNTESGTEEQIHRNILEEVYRNHNIGSSSAASLMMEMFRRQSLDDDEEDDEPNIPDDPRFYKKIVISDMTKEELHLSEWTEVVDETEESSANDEVINDEIVNDEVINDEVINDEVANVMEEMIQVIEEQEQTPVIETQFVMDDDLISELDPVDTVSKPVKNSPYQKMNVQMLRTLVIQKNLCADPSKMKKLELIQLLI
jgi:hypothetical protein